jgi:acyl dehydratase
MPLDYQRLMALPPTVTQHEMTERDTILYALGIGANDLRHVYEARLEALPMMAVILAYPGFFGKDPRYELTWQKILHGEQSVEIHRPLPTSGTFIGTTQIDEIYDKGPEKGAIMLMSRVIRVAGDPDPIATVRSSNVLRGDGGFAQHPNGAPPAPHPVPGDRPADIALTLLTREDQALLYRLSGDYNPLHVEPEVARGAGFDRPILHGLCTFGVVGRALIDAVCGGDGGRLRRMDVRFSSPVYPGETIRTEIWREGEGQAAFRASVVERGVVVINNGRLEHS